MKRRKADREARWDALVASLELTRRARHVLHCQFVYDNGDPIDTRLDGILQRLTDICEDINHLVERGT
jgi:hypothetical protein